MEEKAMFRKIVPFLKSRTNETSVSPQIIGKFFRGQDGEDSFELDLIGWRLVSNRGQEKSRRIRLCSESDIRVLVSVGPWNQAVKRAQRKKINDLVSLQVRVKCSELKWKTYTLEVPALFFRDGRFSLPTTNRAA